MVEDVICRPHILDRFANFKDLFLGFLKAGDLTFVDRFVMVCRSVWFKRNAVRLKQVSLPYDQIFSDAAARLHEFHLAADPTVMTASIPSSNSWSPPQTPFYKANFDGALFQDINKAGIGVVIRDSAGLVIGALSEIISLPPSVIEVEALACQIAIIFARELGLQEVVFEGDSETLIKSLNSESTSLSQFGHLVDDSRAAALELQSYFFSHIACVDLMRAVWLDFSKAKQVEICAP
ncbi:uncharacterized protein LOC142612138 [Castanea sativa]|uniref:uncharacterized protein LOC142612138 n=1 Tax=Castanea sativa TaxID=21020 RepID=UPI003F652060